MVALQRWPRRRWIASGLGAVVAALAVGIPTRVIPNPWFSRMTEVRWWDPLVLVVTSALAGLLVATYVRMPAGSTRAVSPTPLVGGGLLSAFAVGCPICNKLVVAAIGVSGALRFWAPLQPVLAVASIALIGLSLRQRLIGDEACPVRV